MPGFLVYTIAETINKPAVMNRQKKFFMTNKAISHFLFQHCSIDYIKKLIPFNFESKKSKLPDLIFLLRRRLFG